AKISGNSIILNKLKKESYHFQHLIQFDGYKMFENIFDNLPETGNPKTDKFIIDSGESPIIFTNTNTSEEIRLPRYAVWAVKGHRKPIVIDTNNDLELLRTKHSTDRVYKVEDFEK
ncbi:MAG: hypothetical protein ACC656_09595, partial [Candidatus Heimdallarchaeota archaeon]